MYDDPLATDSLGYLLRVALGAFGLSLALLFPAAAYAAPPTADFTFTPASPAVGEEVTFTSTSTDDGALTTDSYAWDLDGDGAFDEAVGPTATWVFARPGSHTVRLRVTDAELLEDVESKEVIVTGPPNQLPTASFHYFPANPTAGRAVDFVSVSSDPDGPIVAHEWDLNGDGAFGDASGDRASRTFPAGSHTVGLRVRDSRGAESVQTRVLVVAPALVTLRLISPFPVVRLVGRLTRRGARIRLFSVGAPPGSSVVLRCNGPRCPTPRFATTIPATGAIRLRRFERRLRAGVVLKVFVTRNGSIGKYTRFGIRRRRSPSRRDSCLQPGAKTPSSCPDS